MREGSRCDSILRVSQTLLSPFIPAQALPKKHTVLDEGSSQPTSPAVDDVSGNRGDVGLALLDTGRGIQGSGF